MYRSDLSSLFIPTVKSNCMLPFSRTFSGIPAISLPSEYDYNGLPSDGMLHGKWYDVAKLIKTFFHLEKIF